MYGELFLPHNVPEKYQELRAQDPEKFFRFCETSSLKRPKVTHAYLDHVYERSENATGFKLMAWPFMTHPEILSYCKKNDIHIIYLTRNIQERVISYAVAEKRNHFHSLEQHTESEEKIILDKKRVTKLYKKQRLLSNLLDFIVKRSSSPVLSIDYEQLHDSPDDTMHQIHEFLGLKEHKPSSSLLKTATASYEAMVKNIDDVKAVF